MHIAIVTSSFPQTTPDHAIGGAFAKAFAHALSDFAQVTVLAPGPSAHETFDGKIQTLYFSTPVYPVSLMKLHHPSDWPKIAITFFQGQTSLNRLLAHECIDHLLALWALPAGLWAMRTAMRFKIAYSVWALGSDVLVLCKNPLLRPIVRTVLRKAHARFADGYGLMQEVARLSGKPCDFMPTGRALPLQGEKRLRNHPPFRFAYLGRLHPIKGIDLLLRALERLHPVEWNAIERVRICGDGPLREGVHAACERLARKGHPVVFEGRLDDQGVARLLYETDYLIIPSRSESIPVVFSEALQTLTPVICTPAGDLPMLLKQYKVGILANEAREEALLQAIRQALGGSPSDFIAPMRKALRVFDCREAARRFLQRL